jgi:CRISPR/Cas system-associated exonuclease Cas4 (RecB family)
MEKDYFVTGKIAHSACEYFHKDKSEDSPADKMSRAFKQACEKNKYKEHLTNGIIKQYNLFDVKGMLADYLAFLENTYKPYNVYATEQYFKMHHNGIVITGMIDRIDEDELGDRLVVDYKTGKNPVDPKDELESVQLPIYAYFCQRELKCKDVVTTRYINLKFIGLDQQMVDFKVDGTMIEHALSKFKEVHNHLNEKKPFSKNKKYKYCYACDYRIVCRDSDD